MGQLPFIIIDEVKLPQSMSIARYLAREFNLAGKTNLEQAQADAVVDTCVDIWSSIVDILHLKDEKEKVSYDEYLCDDSKFYQLNFFFPHNRKLH